MKLYSYALPKTGDHAPNPYFGYCTLAIGKPIIRKCAEKGDWIAAYSSADTESQGKLMVLMRVEEILAYDEYWEDERFCRKRPTFNRDCLYTYGDNIYHHVGFRWVREQSHSDEEDESTIQAVMRRDTQTNRVLIAKEFYYFGDKALEIPQQFGKLIAQGPGNGVYSDKNVIEAFVKYVRESYGAGE